MEGLMEFEVRPDRSGMDRRSFTWMYWRKTDLDIVAAPGWPTEFRRQVVKGMVPLAKYGEFLPDDPERGINVNRDAYSRLLAQGGAEEFSVKQVLEMGWHRNPPKNKRGQPYEFPQLPEEITEYPCSFCPKVLLSEVDRRRHESIAHKEISSQSQLARLLGEATSGQIAPAMADMFKMMLENQARLEERANANDQRLEGLLTLVANAFGPSDPKPEPKGKGKES